MAARKERPILWEVGCEGHTDAWVNAPDWELATVEAAGFWGVPWKEVAAHCECKQRIEGAPGNICCRCGERYFGGPPTCARCLERARWEEAEQQRRLRRAYQLGKVL